MPIPLLFIAVAAATGSFGIGKTVKAGFDASTAKQVSASANSILDKAKVRLNKARKSTSGSLDGLGRTKVEILSGSITEFVKVFETIKNIELKKSEGLDELSKFIIDKESFKELKELGGYASSIIGGVGTGALAGSLTAFGAYSAAGAFAQASTGILISELSGAAATNATLAFFGGGSLATGGLGMAGGSAVLGGLVAGPALAIMGVIVGAKASKAKDDAYANLAEAKKISDELGVAQMACEAIGRRADMFSKLLVDLKVRFVPVVQSMKDVVNNYGSDYKKYPKEAKETIAAALSLAGTIKAVIDTPILTTEGTLTEDSLKICSEVKSRYTLYKNDDIIDMFKKEDRPGYVGNLDWDTISTVSKQCCLPDNNYIVYAHVSHHYGTGYFVVTTDAVAYVHKRTTDVESDVYIPFSTISDVRVECSDGKPQGIVVIYKEDDTDKAMLFTTCEVGDFIGTSKKSAENFADLLSNAVLMSD